MPPQEPAEDERAEEHVAAGQLGAGRVGDFGLALAGFALANEEAGDKFHFLMNAGGDGSGSLVEDRLADLMQVARMFNRRPEVDGHRIREALGPFPEEFFPLKAEDAPPQTVEID